MGELVPAWPELNDALFWQSTEAARTRLEGDGKQLKDDWPVQCPQALLVLWIRQFARECLNG